eukprot:gnl/Spiro4/16365_TR8784_c0_g1_i1.p2 gnl/Spiro4/16365_TR8784_c0_g1~~gnl/Spiro4/16365_TR8784_c0_g1_i1.p2  ORF type:complete len:431 (-),score=155.80 gnl/Spiro4/16365_TR8784_c0_g1_i1:68-1327(-)
MLALTRFGGRVSRLLSSSAAAMLSSATARPEPAQAASLIEQGTRSIFNEEHDAFRESARKFYASKVVPFHDKWEDVGHVPRDLWLEAGSAGLLGVTMPDSYGGAGCDILYAAINWEEQSYTGCTGPGWALHSEIVMPYILNYGTPDQKQKYLPKMITGELIGAIAMTEPGAGSDLQGVRTTAIAQPDGTFLLNGSKTYITNGFLSDLVIVVAKTEPAKGAHGTSLVIVETGMKGFEKGKKLKKMGLRAQDTAELFFENVVIPKENVLGGVNKGFYQLMQELPQERLMIADMAVAAAEANFENTRKYTKERKAFGKTIADLQTSKHKLAEMKTEICVARAFIDRCLVLHAERRLDSQMASMAKYYCTDLQNKIADRCVQLHGGMGYMWEMPVCRHFVDARVQSIYGGANEIMKELIGRSI